MSYYDDASLVVIPSGYKTSKVYAEKPTDGSGDLTFTRTGDTATRVNSAGIIEKVRTNVVLQSQDQSNSAYSSVINQITSRTAVANPLTGSSNAYKILSAGGTDPYIGQVVNGLSNGENTFSLWLWTDSGQNVNCDLIFYNATASEIYTKSITITTTPTRYDHTVNFTSVGANATVRLDLCQSCGITYVYTYGWQVESGVATAYTPTTTAAVSVGPVANVPRLDYLGSTCPRLNLEPQRSNLITFSEQLNNAAWFKTAAGTGVVPVVTANDTTSPDGYQNADKIVFNSGAGTTSTDQSLLGSAGYSITNGTAYTVSFYAKGAVGGEQLAFRHSTSSFNKITLTTSWQRYTLTHTATLTGTSYFDIGIRRGLVEPLNSSATVFIWGCQLEQGAYSTSLIPTLAASATRGADACSKTGISSLIGQTEGTLYWEGNGSATSGGVDLWLANISVDDTSVAVLLYYVASTGTVQAFINNGTSNVILDAAMTLTQVNKVAVAYKNASFALYLNGTLVDSSSSAIAPPTGMNQFSFVKWTGQTNQQRALVSQALLFPTRLTNAELAELTTL